MTMTQEPDIAIIGAGAAGIGAARRLARSGFSTLIIEAMPRIGGRAHTQMAAGVPLDLGCEWLHSADRNPWVRIAEEAGFPIDRRQSAWGTQFGDLGFPPADADAARRAFDRWSERLAETPPISDNAAESLDSGGMWTPYLQAISGYLSGDDLERISASDYTAYDNAATDFNWRLPSGYGTLITASLPASASLRLGMPVEAIALDERRIVLQTPNGSIRSRVAIVTVSTNVLAGASIKWPSALDPWRQAAARLPLGANEKLFLEIVGASPFMSETHVIGDPHDATTGSYYIKPFGWPVIECFLGGGGARFVAAQGTAAAFERAIDQLVSLFGSTVRQNLKPLIASDWAGTASVGGAYSHALPGESRARARLAQPYDGRLFFAGEATHATNFSTAHGALQSGVRAAEEVLAVLGHG